MTTRSQAHPRIDATQWVLKNNELLERFAKWLTVQKRISYPAAIGLTFATIAIRAGLEVFGDGIAPFALFYPLILVCVLLGGLGPGLISLTLSALAVLFFWLEPRYEFFTVGIGVVNQTLFVVSTGMVMGAAYLLRLVVLKLRESEERLSLSQEAGCIGMWDLDLRSGKAWWSPLFYEVTGISTKVQPSTEAFFSRIHPADRHRASLAFQAASEGAGKLNEEFRFVRDDGKVVWLVGRGELFYDAQGKPARMTGINFDVTPQRSAEQERDEAASLLRTFFNTLPGAAYAKDKQGRILMGNPDFSAAVGVAQEAFIGKTDSELLPNREQAEQIMVHDRIVMDEKVTKQIEEDLVLPDGRMIRWLSIKTPLTDNEGEVRGIVGISLDVTERREAEERLRLLAHEVDHRAKNLLGVVHSVIRLTNADDVETFKSAVTGRIHALARAHTLLAENRWEGIAISTLIREELAPLPDGSEMRIDVSGPDIYLQPAASQALAMTLHELITNAVKYGALSNDDGIVSLSWSVSESGQRKSLELVWSEQSSQSVTEPTQSGFGMKVIRSSIEHQLQGVVELDWLPDGLTCRIHMPHENVKLVASEAEATTEAQSAGSDSFTLAHKLVLIVEDEAFVALFLEDVVQRLGGRVLGPASSSKAAIQLIKTNRPDFAILDLNLGGENSLDCARLLRSREVPFVYCTGYANTRDRISEDLRAEVLSKPVRAADLARAMKRAMS